MKTTIKLAAVTTLMLLAVVACGKKGDAGDKPGETSTTSAAVTAKASCDMLAELGTCNEYSGGEGAARTSFGLEKSLCEGFHGKFANAGCSTAGQIGSCLMGEGEVKRYYGSKIAGDHALSIEEAKSDCESELVKGKFTVDPNAASATAAPPEEPKPAAKPAAKPAKPAAKSAPGKAPAAKK
jgi:hypothetical protein